MQKEMTSIGSNIGSSSGIGSSRRPLVSIWVSLTWDEHLTNFKRIIRKQYTYIEFHDSFFELIAKVLKALSIDPWVDIDSFLLGRDLHGLLDGTTPLHWAVLMDDRTMVQYILTSRRVNINASTRGGGITSLHYAIIGGNCDIVEDLLEHKADVCMCNSSSKSALYYMVLQKDSMFGILKNILVNNVNMCDEVKDTPLHHAAREGAIDVVSYLLDEKANVDLCNELGYTPLHYATKKGSLDVVTHLLEKNANVNARDDRGWSPLHIATREGATNIVSLLAEYKANVNAFTKDGICPLHIAARGGYFDITTCLVEHNADVNALDKDGLSPLYLAFIKGYFDIVNYLTEHNAIAENFDEDGWSPLLHSIRHRRVEISNELIASGVNVHVMDKWSNNALHLAIQAYGQEDNMMDIVKLLRKLDVDANAKNSQGYSPFFVVVGEGHTEVVKELLKSKEQINLMEECNGQTAIQIAFDYGHEHIKRLLLECDDVSRYVDALYRDRQVYVDAANAILVGAALIASVTFASWLQPPLGYTSSSLDLAPSSSNIDYVDIQHNKSLRAFWIFNAFSFYFAIGTVVFGARSVLPRRQMFIKAIVVKLHQNLLITSILLACSVFCVIIAFGIAGCIVLTPTLQFQWYVIVPTIFGGLVCSVSLVFLFKSIVEDNIEKKRKEKLFIYFR